MDIQFEEFKKTFFQECDELLADLEHQLSVLKADAGDPEPLHAAFRAVHSIKGGAGMFGFAQLVAFAHEFENALRSMRSGRVAISEPILDATIQASDVISDLVQAARNDTAFDPALASEAAERLAAAVGIDSGSMGEDDDASLEDDDAFAAQSGGHLASSQTEKPRFVYDIAFRPARHLLQRMNEPILIFRHLQELGLLTVEADISGLPNFADLEPMDAHISWALTLETYATIKSVREAFEYVEGDCELSIECRLDRGPPQPVRPVAVVSDMEPRPSPPSAIIAPTAAAAVAARGQGLSSIRVDLDRIDRLVNMVGEIAVSQTMVFQHIDRALTVSNPQLFTELSQLLKLTQLLQDSVMAIRAQPIRSIFARMPRVVRDLMAQTGKTVRLETFGEETEIDKTLVEQLVDPLTHMVRNAVDHGIESSAEREAKGKPAEGSIRISAAQRGSQIVIEVSDDGRGIDRERVREKAVEQKLIHPDAALTDDEITNLLFAPGFSTADKVSNISGRGVGMDVVKRNIQKMGGRVSLTSESGVGSKVVITLPLTLAVTDGMIIRVGRESYVLPIASIVECIAVSRQQVKVVPGSGELLYVRGAPIKVVHLAHVFDIASTATGPQILVILVEIDDGHTIALVVDEIVDQQQVVMKSVRENLDQVAGIAGATILGNGAVALFLDVAAIAHMATLREPRRTAAQNLHPSFGKHVA